MRVRICKEMLDVLHKISLEHMLCIRGCKRWLIFVQCHVLILLEMILKQPLQKDYFTSLLQNYWKPWNACFTARCTRYWHHYNKKQQIDISLDKCHRVTTERSHCLGPALEIETSHRRLVRQRKLPSVLKVGHLESHLYEGIGTDLEKWLTGHNVITSNN